MSVDHGSNIGATLVHLGVKSALEMHVWACECPLVLEFENKYVAGGNLIEANPLSFYVDLVGIVATNADMTKSEILVSLEGEESAGPR
jgi:hypothetical protein